GWVSCPCVSGGRGVAEMVEKMPRSIGIRCGVKTTCTGSPATSDSACSISGVWRGEPGEEGETPSVDLGEGVVSVGGRPAPGAPLLPAVVVAVRFGDRPAQE